MAALAASGNVPLSACGAGCDVSPLRAIDWLPCGSFATGAIDLSGSGAGCDISCPLWATDWLPCDSLATGAIDLSGSGGGCDVSPLRAIDWLPCGSFATGAIDLSGSGGGCDVSCPLWATDWLPCDSLATVGDSSACWVIFADGSGDISRPCCSGAITRSCGFCLITIAAPASESTMLSATASDRLACASAGGTTFARLDEALGGRAGGRCWRTGDGGAVARPRSKGAAGALSASEDGTDFKLVGWPSCAGLGDAPASIRLGYPAAGDAGGAAVGFAGSASAASNLASTSAIA